MLGVAVDPNFVVNNYIYIYYTAKKFGVCTKNEPDSPVNRVSRFVLGSNDLVDPLSETPIVDGIPDPDGIHAGGDVEFGPDGNLWISTGDGGCDFRGDSGCYPFNDAAQDLGVLSGKVLRVTKTGAIPLDNPYAIGPDTATCSPTGYTLDSGICREIYSSGLRNPFRFAIDPNSATPFGKGERRRSQHLGGGEPAHAWRELRLERARGQLRSRLQHRLRASSGRHDEPDPFLQPQHRLRLDHGLGLRAQRALAEPVRRGLPVRGPRLPEALAAGAGRLGRVHADGVRHRHPVADRRRLRPRRRQQGLLLHQLGGLPERRHTQDRLHRR